MESEVIEHYLPYIVIFNSIIVVLILITFGYFAGRKKLKEEPDGIQNFGELILDWFYNQARDMQSQKLNIIVSFLATLFFFILISNLLALLPFPMIKIPPTAYYSVPFALALCAIFGILVISGVFNGFLGAIKHLFWPNPIQIVTEISDVLSLSLRLFGNIGGEFIVASLVLQTAPYGIPVVIHFLGLIPAFVQPLVFTLLTANFLAGAIHHEEEKDKEALEESKEVLGKVEPASEGT